MSLNLLISKINLFKSITFFLLLSALPILFVTEVNPLEAATLKVFNDLDKENAIDAVRKLQAIAIDAQKIYDDGNDNNYISMETVENASRGLHPSRAIGSPAGEDLSEEENYSKKRKAVIARCVFMSDGAHAEHISDYQQSYLAEWFDHEIHKIRTEKNVDIRLQEITHYATAGDVIYSGCTLRIHIPKADVDILMDSFSYD